MAALICAQVKIILLMASIVTTQLPKKKTYISSDTKE